MFGRMGELRTFTVRMLGFRLTNKIRVFSYLVIAYMLLAMGWWTYLHHKKNRTIFEKEVELRSLVLGREYEEFVTSADYEELRQQFLRQERMIIGEGLFIMLSLFLAGWFVYRGFRQEVETANLKRNFLLSISHELKSPIASLKMALTTLNASSLTEVQRKTLTTNSINDLDRLEQMVHNLLLSARVESNYKPYLESIDLKAELERIVQSYRLRFTDLELHFELSETIFIDADRQGLCSIIYNLVDNAIKYSLDQKRVDIEVESLDDSVILRIKDQGIGLAEAEAKKIFDRFYRVGSEDTRTTQGTGLGLYIVKEISKAHGWSYGYKANLPQGSIFWITIPKSLHKDA